MEEKIRKEGKRTGLRPDGRHSPGIGKNDDVCRSCSGVPTFVATRQNLWFSSAIAASYPWHYKIHRIGLDKGEDL